MDLHDPRTSRLQVEAVHVLGGQEEAVAEEPLEGGQGAVGSVRRGGRGMLPAQGVEAPDELGVGREALRRGDLLHGVAVPQAARAAERGEAAFGRDAGPGEHQDPGPLVDGDPGISHVPGVAQLPGLAHVPLLSRPRARRRIDRGP